MVEQPCLASRQFHEAVPTIPRPSASAAVYSLTSLQTNPDPWSKVEMTCSWLCHLQSHIILSKQEADKDDITSTYAMCRRAWSEQLTPRDQRTVNLNILHGDCVTMRSPVEYVKGQDWSQGVIRNT